MTPPNRPAWSSFNLFLALLLVLSGCATLKQCAYDGINRDEWQQPARVIASLGLHAGQHVADLGAGGGYFTFRLAQAVGPAGKVYAVDVDPDMTALIERQAAEQGAANVAVVLARPDDPLLPADGIDLVLTVNTYHHLPEPVKYFRVLRKALRPQGRIAIIDFDERGWFEGLWNHATSAEQIKRDMKNAGYVLVEEFDFLDRQSFLVFGLPAGSAKQSDPLRNDEQRHRQADWAAPSSP